MSSCYRTECENEDAAISAWYATYGVFDDIDGADSYAYKRHGAALLWRFDDPHEIVRLMVERLDRSGLFIAIEEISEREFWAARSYSV